MKNQGLKTEEEARQAILAVLQRIPDVADIQVDLEPWTEKYKADLQITFRKQAERTILLAEVSTSGQPRMARAAVNQLMALQPNRPGTYGVFVAPIISDASAAICKENGIGYIDFTGNCWLNVNSIFIEIKGNASRSNGKPGLKSFYKPKAERILRTLLCNPERQWSSMDLAASANVSVGLVSNVRKLLLGREWIQDQPQGITLTAPWQLLGAWRESYQPSRNTVYEYYDMNSVGQIELQLATICKQTQTRYAFTSFSGASRYAPFTTYNTVSVYMDIPDITDRELVPFKPVTSGANVRIILPYDEGVYDGKQSIRGQTVVSAIQCYLDLKDEKARGEEAAEALLEQVIKPPWQ